MLIFVLCENEPPHGNNVQDWAQNAYVWELYTVQSLSTPEKETGAFLMRRRHRGNTVDSPKAYEGVSLEVCKSDTAPGAWRITRILRKSSKS